MITPGREQVIENIRRKALEGRLNDKVETGDPSLTSDERSAVLRKYIDVRRKAPFRIRNFVAGRMADLITWKVNRDTEITGLEKLSDIKGGAIITSNHFNPDENTAIRLLSQKMKKGNLYVVSQDSNLKMPGLFGFFMYYMDVIPVSKDYHYMRKHFDRLIDEALGRGQNILVYPELEMWFNYRKPRPVKRGAYLYAARHNVPVISCFNEIVDLPEHDSGDFHKVKYVLHVLDPIYPQEGLTERENSMRMAAKDYEQKCRAYEECYGRKLTYEFEERDIAGWEPGLEERMGRRINEQKHERING